MGTCTEIYCIPGTAPLRCFCASVGNCPEERSAFIASRLKGGALQPWNSRLAKCSHVHISPCKGLSPRLEKKGTLIKLILKTKPYTLHETRLENDSLQTSCEPGPVCTQPQIRHRHLQAVSSDHCLPTGPNSSILKLSSSTRP